MATGARWPIKQQSTHVVYELVVCIHVYGTASVPELGSLVLPPASARNLIFSFMHLFIRRGGRLPSSRGAGSGQSSTSSSRGSRRRTGPAPSRSCRPSSGAASSRRAGARSRASFPAQARPATRPSSRPSPPNSTAPRRRPSPRSSSPCAPGAPSACCGRTPSSTRTPSTPSRPRSRLGRSARWRGSR